MKLFPHFALASGLLASSLPACAQLAPQPGAGQSAKQPLARGTLLQLDFNGVNPWAQAATDVMPSTPIDVATTIEAKAVGTIDVAGSTASSGGLLLKTEVGEVGLPWIATYNSGLMPLQNSETNLGKLTLSLSLSASSARPIVVRVESFGAKKLRSGGLETTIYPAAPDFYQRYALDFSRMQPSGAGKFNPTDPNLQLSFELQSPAWTDKASHEVRIDNVHLATPAYYVSATGSDNRDGRTEATAFASPQKALDVAGPGDIIAVMSGTYLPVDVQGGIASFRRAGTPAGWISLKNYPGHQPLFQPIGAWAAVRIGQSPNEAVATANAAALAAGNPLPALAYLEVRGLHVRGEGDVAKAKYPEALLSADPRANANGLMAHQSNGGEKPHHLRFADNLVEFCPGGGITPNQVDWVTIENNIVRNNCWTTRYGASGISFNGGGNFDGTVGGYRVLIRNNVVSGNRTFEPWAAVKKISDGNGIIIDVNQDTKLAPEQRFSGRTLIAGNLSFNNGGSGIHAYKSNRVDIINNTLYMNSASPELPWGQLFVQQAEDIRMINNILVARPGEPVNTVSANSGDQNSKNIVRLNNIYFGGGTAPLMGEGDIIADPMFVNPSTDPAVADFRLKPGSPALKSGKREAFGPLLDITGKPRPLASAPDKGAYQIP